MYNIQKNRMKGQIVLPKTNEYMNLNISHMFCHKIENGKNIQTTFIEKIKYKQHHIVQGKNKVVILLSILWPRSNLWWYAIIDITNRWLLIKLKHQMEIDDFNHNDDTQIEWYYAKCWCWTTNYNEIEMGCSKSKRRIYSR